MTIAWPYPFWIAHRGGGRHAPENTLAAFREGAAHGFRMAECDVKLSADGVPFLLHDSDLERTTSGLGNAGEQPWTALSRLDAGAWYDLRHAGEPLPTLDAIARFVRANRLALNLEIKPIPGLEARTGETVARATAALWADHTPAPLLSSFSIAALEAAQATAPELPRALLLDDLYPGWPELAARLDCIAVITDFRWMDTALVARLHAEGRRALAYTVNDPATAHQLINAGIDGLITDEIVLFSAEATG